MSAQSPARPSENVLRWIAVLPCAFITYVGIQFLNIVGSALDFRYFLEFDSLPQLLSTLIGATVFVVVGAKIAPARQARTAAALVFAVAALHCVTLFAAIEGSRDELLLWLSLPVSAVGGIAGYLAVRDDELKAAEAELTHQELPVPVDGGS